MPFAGASRYIMTTNFACCRMSESKTKSGMSRRNVHLGDTVDIVQKMDQRTGKLTRGVVKDILTNSPSHPHGIKVRLQTGQVGRVQAIITVTK